jgi:Tfp pilus assembly protein PilF
MRFSRTCFVLFFTLILFVFIDSALRQHTKAKLESQVALQASSLEKREEAYRANNLGVALLEQYKAREATDSFTRALSIKPDLLLARINLSIALYYLPDADGAKREAEKALGQDLKVPQAHYILGLIARGQSRFDDAITEFGQVLKTDPGDVGANINLGQLFVQQKRYPEATTALRKALDVEPYNETALYNLGILLMRTGARQEGQQLLQKFQQFQQSGAGTIIGTNYLEGGHYAEAIVSTGA